MTILPQLEQDLFEAAKERLPAADDFKEGLGRHDRLRPASAARWPRFRRRLAATAAALPVLGSIVVTVAVVAVALIAFKHDHTSKPAATPGSASSSRQELIQTLAVLRRPQTKADLNPELLGVFSGPLGPHRPVPTPPGLKRQIARWGNPELDRSLVRVIRIPAWHAKLAFEPATFQPSASTPHRTEGLELELWTGLARTIPPSTDDGTGPRPTSVGVLLAHGLTLIGGPLGRDGVVVVPDGVARVTLGPIRLIGPPARVDASKFGTVTAAVRDNVAAFRMPMLTASNRRIYSGLFGVPAVAQAVWFDPTGKVIKRTTTDLDLIIKVVGKGPLPRPPAARLRLRRSRFCHQNPHAC